MSRRYGKWAGNPKGQPEDLTRCIEEVWPTRGSMIPYQCTRKRRHGEDGLRCYQHAKGSANIRPMKRED